MAKILLINPNKWGRGVTHIWIASHSGLAKRDNHIVDLFDSTFFKDWTSNEHDYNTQNKQYKKTDYNNFIKFNDSNVKLELQNKINNFKPDVIFWSAISSHIHGEGEYVNIEYGYELIKDLEIGNAILITGGLQATSNAEYILKKYHKINYIIRGESEIILTQILNYIDNKLTFKDLNGIAFIDGEQLILNKTQNLISNMDILSPYDYSIFNPVTFYRSYNGEVVKAIDYELSRGCIYSCGYCVETVIQNYYGFKENNANGAIKNFKKYLRNKSAKVIFNEILNLNKDLGIILFRCQDTNFLTIDRKVLEDLGDLIDNSNLNIKLYIETRPEGINEKSIKLLKKLKVDGVGMGVELSSQDFREDYLNRYADHNKILNAFKLLKANNIKTTAYNVIGFPNQNENSIWETINLNKTLEPDNITVAFFSPYHGTNQQKEGNKLNLFDSNTPSVDNQLRTTQNEEKSLISNEKLNYFKKNFFDLVYAKK